MSLETLLILLLVAGICGAIGQAISGGWTGGILGSIVVGFIGWLIGSWLAGRLGLGELLPLNIGGWSFPILWSIIGSALIGLLLNLFVGRDHVVVRRYPDL
ncbi:MAG: GlsB/YeaQ/YmgE family stress response membrane protein [Blastocatellia bacterium]